MRFAGIDIGAEQHVVAVVDDTGATVTKSTTFAEDAGGYERCRSLLGEPKEVLVAMEATGHYWQNLFAVLAGRAPRVEIRCLAPDRSRPGVGC